MQISSTPIKWTLPFAANDSAKVEIPATTSDPTRFSLSLGSPPLTGQPPESGGVPPQLEDFNGAMNQISRMAWWAMGGGPLPYDGTWAADPNVNGYANGAQIPTADGQGRWVSIVDNNTANPDTVGTNWAPGWAYGALSLTGQTGGTTTLTPAQAIKRTISIAGTLTSNLTVVLPAWVLDWTITNTTSGAFTVTVKTAAGSGVAIPQNNAPTRVHGDGTNITQLAENIAAASQLTQSAQLGQLQSAYYAVDTGAANVYVVAYTPAVTALTDGLRLRFKIKTANTGASTLNVNGLGAQPIVGGAHAALQGGEFIANGDAEVVWNSTLASFILLENTGGALQVANATLSQQAVSIAQLSALRSELQFTASGNFTVPAGIFAVFVRAWGAGGGGGGTSSGSTSTAAAGGAGGGYREGWIGVTPGQVVAVTIGAGGSAGGNNTAGGTGGTTSFGAFLAAGGGGGGAASASGNAAGNNSGGVGTGGNMGVTGQGGGGGINYGTTTYEGGAGGAAFSSCQPIRAFGTSSLGSNGNSGYYPGGGGSGGCCSGTGGVGANGLLIVSF